MNDIKIKEISAGDVILYHGSGLLSRLIRFFDGTEVNHAAVCIGDGKVGEALSGGLTTRTVQESIRDDDYVIVRRLKTDPGTMQPVVDKAGHYLALGNRYGYEQLVLLALLGLTRKLDVNETLAWLLRSILDQAADLLMKQGERQPMICSEFVYRCYNEALPAAHDPYALDITPFSAPTRGPVSGAPAFARDAGRKGYHRDSLLAWAEGVASSRARLPGNAVALSLEEGAGHPAKRVMSAEEKRLSGMPLETLIQKYLAEVKKPKTRSLEMEASLRSPAMLQSIGRFSQAFHAATQVPKAKGAPAKSAVPVPEALDRLIETVSDFVTPGDLYKCDSLSSIGKIKPSPGIGRE
jgi:hypothetical protein